MSKICIIIPCYNEGERLPVQGFKKFSDTNEKISFLFVNDASTDNTKDVLEELCKNDTHFKYINLDVNQGKSGAVLNGMQHAIKEDFNIYGYFDADLATPLNEILRLAKFIDNDNMVFSFGSRIRKIGSQVNRTVKRHIFGRIFATFASNILKLAVYDTQCGAKLFSKEAAIIAFKDAFVSRWFFDIEIIHRLKEHYGDSFLQRSMELPVIQWKEVLDSKITFKDMIKTPLELMKIKNSFKTKTNG